MATAAETAANGKICLLGAGFDTFTVGELPALVPPFYMACRFSAAGVVEEEFHTLGSSIISPSGVEETIQPEGVVRVNPPREGIDLSYFNALIAIQFRFTEEGKHLFTIDADGKRLKALPIYLMLKQQTEGES